MKMSLGRKFTSTSPARVRKIRVFPTSHQSRIDRAQGHSQQWSLWKPGSQEGAGGEHKEGLARVSQVASPELPWCPVYERQHLLVPFQAVCPPTPVPSARILLPSPAQALSCPSNPPQPSPQTARGSDSVCRVPGRLFLPAAPA